jgi:TPR repeat protein
MSADQGHDLAQRNYGVCLTEGKGIGTNLEQAAKYYKMSADQGNSYGQNSYGYCLSHGKGVPGDLEEAVKYYKLSADQGNALGQNSYGHCLEYGKGVPKDLEEAAKYYKLSADQGNASGQNDYANFLLNGKGVAKNAEEAMRYFRMSADQGNADGQLWVAALLYDGAGVSQDYEEAAKYFKMAADQGDARGQYYYAECLEKGRGVRKDLDLAAKYYKLAMDGGDKDAEEGYKRTAKRPVGGKAVPENLEEAAKYYKLSADQGNAFGQNNYGLCLESGKGVPKNLEEAAKYYKMSADQGDPDGQYFYAGCLEKGHGLRKDLDMAAKYYKLAMDGGKKDAEEGYKRTAKRSLGEAIMDFSAFKGVRELGKGGFGVVELMKHNTTSKLIAVKYFQAGPGFDSSRIAREVGALLDLRHPCILEIIGWSMPNSECRQARMATEYMPNGSLEEVLALVNKNQAPKFWTHENITKIIIGVLVGLKFMHSKNIIHRDIKPGNLLLDKDYRVRIGDFGTARFEDCGSTTTAGVGTAAYMAPETMNREQATKKVDVFGFGLIVYEVLFGKSVFPKDGKLLELADLQSRGIRPEIPKTVNPVVQEVIRKCWSKIPDERPTFEAVYEQLNRAEFPFYSDVSRAVISKFIREIGG